MTKHDYTAEANTGSSGTTSSAWLQYTSRHSLSDGEDAVCTAFATARPSRCSKAPCSASRSLRTLLGHPASTSSFASSKREHTHSPLTRSPWRPFPRVATLRSSHASAAESRRGWPTSAAKSKSRSRSCSMDRMEDLLYLSKPMIECSLSEAVPVRLFFCHRRPRGRADRWRTGGSFILAMLRHLATIEKDFPCKSISVIYSTRTSSAFPPPQVKRGGSSLLSQPRSPGSSMPFAKRSIMRVIILT